MNPRNEPPCVTESSDSIRRRSAAVRVAALCWAFALPVACGSSSNGSHPAGAGSPAIAEGGDAASAGAGVGGASGAAAGASGRSDSGAGGALAAGGTLASGGMSAAGSAVSDGGKGGSGGNGGKGGSGGNGGSGGAPVFPLVCTAQAGSSTFTVPTSPGLVRALWWNGGWLFATDSQIGTFAEDGTPLIPFKPFADAAIETGSDPYLAVTAGGLIVAYSGRLNSDSSAHARVVLLDDQLAVKTGPFDIGPAGSEAAGLSPDGQAIAWYQGYLSGDEGYRFSPLAATLKLAGTTDVDNHTFASSVAAEISRGANGFSVFYRYGCSTLQRYDATGARVGATTVLKPADRTCPNDTNVYTTRGSVHAAYASGAHFVGFGEFGENGDQPWTGYAVIDDASGAVRAVKAFPQTNYRIFSGQPTVATFDDRFAIAWSIDVTNATTQTDNYFALVDTDGAQLANVLALAKGLSKFIGPIVAASPTGFVVFLVPATDTTKTYTALKITCH